MSGLQYCHGNVVMPSGRKPTDCMLVTRQTLTPYSKGVQTSGFLSVFFYDRFPYFTFYQHTGLQYKTEYIPAGFISMSTMYV